MCRDEDQHEDDGLFPGRQRGDDGRGREEADEGRAGGRHGAGAVGGRAAPAQPGTAVPGPERDGAHGLRAAADGRGQVHHGDGHPPGAPVGETRTVADPARQPGVREAGARQRHVADGGRRWRRRRRPAGVADGARRPGGARRADGPVRAAHRGRHRRGRRRGGLVLRRPGQPLAGPPGVPAGPRARRRPHVAVRTRLAARTSVPRFRVRGRPTPAAAAAATRQRHTLVPAHAVRHIRLRDTGRLDGRPLNCPLIG